MQILLGYNKSWMCALFIVHCTVKKPWLSGNVDDIKDALESFLDRSNSTYHMVLMLNLHLMRQAYKCTVMLQMNIEGQVFYASNCLYRYLKRHLRVYFLVVLKQTILD